MATAIFLGLTLIATSIRDMADLEILSDKSIKVIVTFLIFVMGYDIASLLLKKGK